jgi:nitroreductase
MSQSKPLDILFGRRSIRAYTSEPVSDAAIRTLLEAAMAAPSAVARDPWRFIVVRTQAMRELIVQKLPHGKMLEQAPVGLIVCGDLNAAHDGQLSYLLQDCAAAIENILVAAHGLGLGACWLGVHPRPDRIEHLKTVLTLPPSFVPVAAIAVGHPAEIKPTRTRFNPDYVRAETWTD